MNQWIPVLFAILAGVFTTVENAMNAKLAAVVTPKIATLHSLILGTVVILAANLAKGTLQQYSKIIYVHPRWLFGGVFGTFIIYFSIRAVPKLGITATLTLIVAAQMISSLVMDMIMARQMQLDVNKLFGVALLLWGTYFITK